MRRKVRVGMSKVTSIGAIVLFLVMAGGVGQAQQHRPGITGKGIKLGAAITSLNTNLSDYEDVGSSTVFTGGIFLTYSLSPTLAIQPEIHFVNKGAVADDFYLDIFFQFGETGLDLSYLEVPVLLKYGIPGTGRLKFSLYTGPALALLLSAKNVDTYTELIDTNGTAGYHFIDGRFDVKDGMRTVDIGLVIGGEVTFPSRKLSNVTLDIRYTLGLKNTINPDDWNAGRTLVTEWTSGIIHYTAYNRPLVENDTSVKNRTLSFLIGYRF